MNGELNYLVVVSNALDFSKGPNEQENTRLMNFIRKVIKEEQNVCSNLGIERPLLSPIV